METTPEPRQKKQKTMKIRLNKSMSSKPAKKVRLVADEDIEAAIIRFSQALSNNYGAMKARYEWLKKLIIRYKDHPEIWQDKKYKTYWDHLLLTAETLRIALEQYINPLYKKENNFFGQHIIETAQKRKDDKRLADLAKKKLLKMKKEQEKKFQESPEVKPEEETIEVDLESILSTRYSEADKLAFVPSLENISEEEEDIDLINAE